jgi:hypothetical protein
VLDFIYSEIFCTTISAVRCVFVWSSNVSRSEPRWNVSPTVFYLIPLHTHTRTHPPSSRQQNCQPQTLIVIFECSLNEELSCQNPGPSQFSTVLHRAEKSLDGASLCARNSSYHTSLPFRCGCAPCLSADNDSGRSQGNW